MRDRDRGLTQDRLKELVHYDPVSGVFTRLRTLGAAVAGTTVEYKFGGGYPGLWLDGHIYYCHRLAWFYVHGIWPKSEIDHIDGRRDNNALANLREATPSQNRRNLKKPVTNTSGVVGVTWCKQTGKWQAGLQLHRKRIHLGRHVRFEDAVAARKAAEKKYFGEFARAA